MTLRCVAPVTRAHRPICEPQSAGGLRCSHQLKTKLVVVSRRLLKCLKLSNAFDATLEIGEKHLKEASLIPRLLIVPAVRLTDDSG
jgi:hypothetical protein